MAADIREWLESLELDKYAAVFAENEIDLDALPHITEDDLKDIGVALGARRKLLAAIAELVPTTGLTPAEEAASDRPASAEAERRQLTVLFCDLVGSTELSARLDPEDLREVMRRYQDAAAGAITRYEGYVAKFLGDGVLAYFGWPQAHEDQAERAVRTGLDAVAAVSKLKLDDNVALQARVGIATGQVVVGDLVGEAAAEAEAVTGETPNLAARLQGLAVPGQVVIGATTRLLIGETFELEDLGTRELKGFAEPVQAWRVVREGDIDSSYEAGRVGAGLPLVGRQEELGLLLRSWEASKKGHGQAVLIQGEAGIGKSRLVEVMREQVSGEDHIRVAHRCSPYHANSTLYPVIEHLKRVMGWKPEDGAEARLEKLEAALKRQNLPPEEAVPLYAELMLVPLPEGRYAPLELSAKQKREQTLDALAGWLLEEAERTSVLNVWEDLHWADPTTLELLGLYIEQSPTVSMLNILTYRPEFVPPWTMRSHMTPITLNRLERPEVEALIGHQANGKAVPSEVIEHIVGKADGVPLYVEELTKTILGSDYLREEADRYTLIGSLSEISIPATLQDSLMARLDRLPKVREVAQLGAVLGREFAYQMMQALGYIEEPILQDGLGQLVAEELLYQRGRPPRAKYVFKHTLIRDAAYHSLLKRTRQQYHRHVARVLEERYSEELASEPELLAYHYTGAEMAPQAIEQWLKAAKRAASRSAYLEAFAHLDSGDALLERVAEGGERTHRRLQLQILRATTLLATKGMSAEETGEAFGSAWELCKRLGEEVEEIFPTLWGIFTFHNVRAEYHLSHEVAEDALQRAERLQEPGLLVLAHRMMGPPLVQSGQPISARDHLEEMRRLYDSERDRDSALVYGVDFKAGGQSFLAQVAFLLGNPDRALMLAEDALSHAEKLEYLYSINFAQVWVTLIRFLRREPELSLDQGRLATTMAAKQGFGQWLAWGKAHCGRALIDLGEAEDGVALIGESLREGEAMGIRLNGSFNRASLAVGAAKMGEFGEAGKHLAEALTEVEKSNERWYEAEIHRLQGEFALDEKGPMAAVAAEECFGRSLDIARRQQAKSWELRAATSLAKLWLGLDKTEEAHDLLAPVYDWFTEGFDTKDLTDAKALLDELA